MNNFFPGTGSIDDWNAAYYRLEDYLRAHLIVHKIHQSQIILRILQRAAERHRADPSVSPVTLAMSEAQSELENWFRFLLEGKEQQPERIAIAGRLGLLLADAPKKWPNLFLETRELPDEFVTAIRAITVQAGPELQISSMVPRPVDILLEEELPHVLRQTFAGMLVALLFGAGIAVSAVFLFFNR
jgi:hypothetical protein